MIVKLWLENVYGDYLIINDVVELTYGNDTIKIVSYKKNYKYDLKNIRGIEVKNIWLRNII